MKPIRVFGRGILVALAASWVGLAQAYTVQLHAPEAVRTLLWAHLDIVRLQNDERMTPEHLARLQAQLPTDVHQLLATQGYFSSRVRSELREEPGQTVIDIHIDLGQETRIFGWYVGVNGAVNDDPSFRKRQRYVRRATGFKNGEPFSQAAWERGKRHGLQQLLIDRYPAAKIAQSAARIHADQHRAELEVHYDSGPAFRLGEIEIDGLQRYPESVVRHLAPFRTGDFYSQQRLLDFQAALQATPYFSSVFVDAEIDPAQAERTPVKVSVEEAAQQRISWGLGYGSNTGERGELNYQHHNVGGRGWIGKIALQAESRHHQQGEVRLSFPVDERGYQDTFFALRQRREIHNLATVSDWFGGLRSRSRGQIETVYGVQYLSERAESDWDGRQHTAALLATYSWIKRKFDTPVNPTRGYAWKVDLNVGREWALSSTDLVRLYVKGLYYWPLRRDLGVIVARAEGGRVWASQHANVPHTLLFRTGGAHTVRGYAFERLGVQRGKTVEGGALMAAASVEYQYPILPEWKAAVFYDVGDAADDWASFRVHHGYGVGVRWATPVGPLVLDVAYGEQARRLRMHFALNLVF